MQRTPEKLSLIVRLGPPFFTAGGSDRTVGPCTSAVPRFFLGYAVGLTQEHAHSAIETTVTAKIKYVLLKRTMQPCLDNYSPGLSFSMLLDRFCKAVQQKPARM